MNKKSISENDFFEKIEIAIKRKLPNKHLAELVILLMARLEREKNSRN